jgi:hypothetical protein
MPVTSTATAKEILTASKWNTLITDINAILAALGGGNIAWPMTAEGNLDMDGNTIVGLQQFWNIINAAEYATGTDYNSTAFQAAITAAEGVGGTCVLVPPDTTFVIKDIEVDATSDKPIMILGCGMSSILQMDSSPTTDMIEFLAGSTDVTIANLQIDGASQGSGKKGIVAKNVTGFRMFNVWMHDFTGAFITLTNSGADGNPCSNVFLNRLLLQDGTSADHIFADDITYANISNITSRDCTQTAINLTAASANAKLSDIRISDCIIDNPTLHGISIVGSSDPADADHTRIQVSDCQVTSAADVSYEIGKSSTLLKYADIANCVAYAPGADAFVIGVDDGSVSGCALYSQSAGDGVVLTTSDTVRVDGCNIPSATTYGIDCGTSANCVLTNNNVTGAGTEGIFRNNATVLVAQSNPGDTCPTIDNVEWKNLGETIDNTSFETMGLSYTVPANTLKDGDVLRISYVFVCGAADSCTAKLVVDGNSLDEVNAAANGGAQRAVCTTYIAVEDIDGTSKTYWYSHAVEQGGDNVFTGAGPLNINWTADITIDAQAKKATTSGTFNYVVIEYMGGTYLS